MFRLALTVVLSVFSAGVSNAGVFHLEFDDVGDGLPLDAPIVGTGTVSWTGPNNDGTFPILGLADFDLQFDFGGDTFTLTDATTPLSEVLVMVSGGGTELFFGNTGPTSGGFAGAIDFVDADNSNALISVLSFEPPAFSPPPASLYFAGDVMATNYFGDYSVVSSSVVPEPSALAVWGLMTCAGSLIPRRRRCVA